MRRPHGAWAIAGFVAACCAVLAACGGASGAPAATAPATTTTPYAAFGSPLAVTIAGYSGDAMEPFISKDGRFLFFNSRNDPSVDTDLFYAARVDDQDFTFVGPVTGADSSSLDAVASMDTLGNFYFVSNRSYATTLSTIYSGSWNGSGVGTVALVPGISLLQAGSVNFDAEISADGQTLWFVDGQYSASGTLLSSSIAVAARQGAGFARRADSASVLAAVNVGGLDYAPSISVDGLELFFTRVDAASAGAVPAIYRSTRPALGSAFAAASLVAGPTGFVEAPTVSADGHLLYFHALVDGRYVIRLMRR